MYLPSSVISLSGILSLSLFFFPAFEIVCDEILQREDIITIPYRRSDSCNDSVL